MIYRIFYLCIIEGEFLTDKAFVQHTRVRTLFSERGIIYDRNGEILAKNENVYVVYVINSQLGDIDYTAKRLSEILELNYERLHKNISKKVALYKVASKVSPEKVEEIRKEKLSGVVIDENYKRVYPNDKLLSHTLGFCGGDNQGIIGIEAKYDKYLKGTDGLITTYTTSDGEKMNEHGEIREEPLDGDSLVLTIDSYIQGYAEQVLEQGLKNAHAKRGSLIVMNPKNGEIYAIANKPDFDLNKPFEINNDDLKLIWDTLEEGDKNNRLNQMWRNFAINDTYEPGSIFKIFTSTVAYEEKLFSLNESFFCPGFRIVEDRRIKCWRFPRSHGSQSFYQSLANSCNPVFIDLARRAGPDKFYKYVDLFKLNNKTGIDLSGEAKGIFLKKSRVGPVEISVMGFGQSFQITAVSLIRMVSIVINGGYEITPHIGKTLYNDDGTLKEEIVYDTSKQIISTETSNLLREGLYGVVNGGGGSSAKINGYDIGGKTATSEKLPRKNGKYIGSFIAFAPYDDPEVIALALIDEPQGQYYGSVVALPIVRELYTNILPYLEIKKNVSVEQKIKNKELVVMPNVIDMNRYDAAKVVKNTGLKFEIIGEGENIKNQAPLGNEIIDINSKIILYSD